MSNYETGHFGPPNGYGRPSQGLNEAEHADLAAELMEVTNEEELEGFLDGLLSRGVQALGKLVGGSTVKTLGGVLKDAAKAVLPVAGGALGSLVGPAGEQVVRLSAPPPAICLRLKPNRKSASGKRRTSS
jgi:hypothetical protein